YLAGRVTPGEVGPDHQRTLSQFLAPAGNGVLIPGRDGRKVLVQLDVTLLELLLLGGEIRVRQLRIVPGQRQVADRVQPLVVDPLPVPAQVLPPPSRRRAR